MCGLIAAFNKKGNVNDWIVNQFEDQHSRGTRGFGSILIDKSGHKILRACETTKALLDLYLNPAEAIIFHHRIPTSTDNWMDQTHPIKVSNGSLKHDYLIIHNGVISNDDELKAKHEALGFVYNTEYLNGFKQSQYNDSEAFAIEIARFIEKQEDELDIQGSFAFIAAAVSKDKKDEGKVNRVFFGRNNGNPLNLSSSNKKIRISSEGEGDEVSPFFLYSFNPHGEYKFDKRKMPVKAISKPEVVNTTIGFVDKSKPSILKEEYDWDGYYGTYDRRSGYERKWENEDNDLPPTLEGEAKKIADECIADALVVINAFLEDTVGDSAYATEVSDAIGDVARILLESQSKLEGLKQTELEATPASGTVLNDTI